MPKPDSPSDLTTPVFMMVAPFESSFSNDIANNPLADDTKKINYNKAFREWLEVYRFLCNNGLVYVLPNEGDKQDLVYAANAASVLFHCKEPTVILSNFTSPPRRGEEKITRTFFEQMKYRVYASKYKHEGEADLKWIRGNIYSGGYGIRTDIRTYQWLSEEFDCHIIPVEMNDKKCYDEETEILTDQGWKFFKDLDKTELVATIDEFGNLEYQKPIDYQSFAYSGNMYSILTKHVDLLITPDHNVYYKNPEHKIYSLEKMELLKGKHRIQLCHTANSFENSCDDIFVLDGVESNIVKSGKNYAISRDYNKKYKNSINFEIDDWCEFMGWYLSEGFINQHKNESGKYSSYQAGICQLTKQDYIDQIHNLLTRMKIKYRYDGRVFAFHDKRFWVYLKQFGKSEDKFIPNWMKMLPSRKLKILFNSLVKGDANIRKQFNPKWKNSGFDYYTKSKKLADDVQEISIKLGYRAKVKLVVRKNNIRYYVVHINNRINYSNIMNDNIKKIYFENINVYDVTVPKYHTLIVRRNGKACISGNCYHYDCCFFVINNNNALVNTSVLDDKDVRTLEKYINIVDVPKGLAHTGITNLCRAGNTIMCRNLEPPGKVWLDKITSKFGCDVRFFELGSFDVSGADLSCLIMHLNKPNLTEGKSVVAGVTNFLRRS